MNKSRSNLQKKHLKDELIILKKININENDLLILAYGKFSGKLILKAKGSKKINSRFTGRLELLSHLSAEIYFSGKSYTLTNAQLIQTAPLKSEYQVFQLSQYICKFLLESLADQDPNPKIFNLLEISNQFLKLNQDPNNFKLFFLIKYLQINGHLGNTSHCHHCQEKFSNTCHIDHHSHFCCSNCLNKTLSSQRLSFRSIKLINYIKTHSNLSNCLQIKVPFENLQESINILNTIAKNSFNTKLG